MITINSIQNKPCHSLIEVFTEKKLPKELMKSIFAFLDPRDLQAAAGVNKGFKILSIDAAKQVETFYLNNFADFIEINAKNDLIKKICLVGKTSLSKGTNLRELKSAILDLKAEIIDVLKTLEKEDIQRLKIESRGLNKSHLFKNLFYLAALYQQFDKTEKLEPSPIRDGELIIICEFLCKKGGNLAKAAEAASKISDESTKNKTLEMINGKSPLTKAAEDASKISVEMINEKSNKKLKSPSSKKRNNCIIS